LPLDGDGQKISVSKDINMFKAGGDDQLPLNIDSNQNLANMRRYRGRSQANVSTPQNWDRNLNKKEKEMFKGRQPNRGVNLIPGLMSPPPMTRNQF
jgi:hypothetical protein